jgi:hypothetical protein
MFRRLLLLTALPALFPLMACAQPPAPAVLADLPSPAQAESPMVSNYVDDRFWIVSSRRVPQGDGQIGSGPLDVWSVDCPDCLSPSPSDKVSVQINRCPNRESVLSQSLTPGVPVCIVVHGSYVKWQTAIEYSWKTFRWLRRARPGQPLHVIFYSWPSDAMTYLPHVDFTVLGPRAARNGFYLSHLLQQVPTESPVSLIGHSQGTRSITSLLHLMSGGSVQGFRLPSGVDRGHQIRVVLTAAAIDHDWLNPGQRYGGALCRTEALLNLVNQRDWALGFYHLRSPASKQAVGRAGFRSRDYQAMGPLAQRIHQMDVTREMGTHHNWEDFISRPDLAASISPYIYFSTRAPAVPERVLSPPYDMTQTRYR